MRNRVVVGGIGLLAAAGIALWWFVLRNDAPPPPELSAPVTTATTPDATAPLAPTTSVSAGGGGGETTTTAAPSTSAAPAADGLDGTWGVVAEDSFVGYRVKEELARVGFTEAVGRTSTIDGSLEISGTTITVVSLTVDMTTLTSDRAFRDQALRSQALETRDFPTATFVLAEPIELEALPEAGTPIQATAVGDLTIHGVTNRVTFPLDAQLTASRIEVVASIDVLFADYDIDAPSAAAVLSVEDEGDVEMQLFFARG